MCVDDAGCLWVAVWGCGELRRYDPAGRLDRTVPLPVSRPTSACFAGTRGDTMVVTSASYGLDLRGPGTRTARRLDLRFRPRRDRTGGGPLEP